MALFIFIYIIYIYIIILYINNKEIYKYLYNWLYVSIDNYGTYLIFNFRHNITEIRSSDCIFFVSSVKHRGRKELERR